MLPFMKYQQIRFVFPLLFLSLLILSSCQAPAPYPRPMAFHRIDFPQEVAYTQFESSACPFTFEYPDMGGITRSNSDSCWVDIYYPQYECTWHITYRDIQTSGKSRAKHFEEWRKLIYQHSKKASQIKENPIQAENGKGFIFEVFGEVGTPAQIFFFDEQEEDLMMMSIYFQSALKNDSLAPVIEYMKEELAHLTTTMEWK